MVDNLNPESGRERARAPEPMPSANAEAGAERLVALHAQGRPTGAVQQWLDGELSESVARSLREKAGLGDDVVPRQLRVFDRLERDTRGRVLSVAHKVWVPYARLAPVVEAGGGALRLVPVGEVGPMPFDHPEIVAAAVDQGRAEYAQAADPGRLLPDSFTLHELWVVHDAVAGHYDSSEDAFRLRAVRLLEPSPEPPRKLDVGRPARLYRRR